MDERVKGEWLTKLRSGLYKQTIHSLRDQHGHCCLGVLCEVAVEEGVIPPPLVLEGGNQGASFDGELGVLPESVWRWAGLICQTPSVVYRHDGNTYFGLVDMNDSGLPFTVIADAIEEQL